MFKQISLAALAAATLITGSIGLAHAESGVSTAASDEGSSASMEQDMRDKMSGAGIAAAPSGSTNAYGYAPGRRPVRSRHARSSAETKHHG
jgi:hypothetical protein